MHQSLCLATPCKLTIQQRQRQKLRLTHDALYNLHELAYDLGDYVKIITTYPDLLVICGLNQLIKELNSYNPASRFRCATAIIIRYNISVR